MEHKPDNQQERFVRRPSRKINLRTSKDGKFVMVDIVETWFFPTRYVATIAANAGKPRPRPASEKDDGETKKVGS